MTAKSLLALLATSALVSGCATAPQGPAPTAVPEGAIEGAIEGAMECGQLAIQLAYDDQARLLRVTTPAAQYLMKPVAAGSGARFEAIGDATTGFWSKGEEGVLTIRDQAMPTCVLPGAVALPFVAHGQEPFWAVTLDAGQLTLEQPGESPVVLGYRELARSATGRDYRAAQSGQVVTLAVARQLCRDTMSGLAYPVQARVAINGELLGEGCGGDPTRLLRGVEWVVEDIAGEGIIDSSRVTLEFLADGRLAGRASCNRYFGSWQQTGEGLALAPLGATRMACAPALMNQEDRFLRQLAAVDRFDIGPHGELLLLSADRGIIRAVQSTGMPAD